MRIVLALFLLISAVQLQAQILFPAEADRYGTQVDPIEVRRAAYALDQHTDEDQRARDYLRVVLPQRYNSVAFDPDALAAELKKVTAELRKFQQEWRKGQSIEIRMPATVLAVEGNIAHLSHEMSSGHYGLGLNYGGQQTPFLPPAYEFLMANVAFTASVELNAKQLEVVQARIKDGNLAAFLALDMQIDKVTQHRYLHGSIRKFRWYIDFQRKDLLLEKVERRNSQKLVAARLLSEGVTLDSVPEHAYDVNGLRLMEPLVQEGSFASTCKDQKRIGGHRVLECRLPRRTNEGRDDYVLYQIVGGRIATASFYGTGKPSELHVGALWEMSKRQHSGPQIPVMGAPSNWSFGEAHFKIFPEVFMRGDGKEPYYVVESKTYLDLLAKKPGTEFIP